MIVNAATDRALDLISTRAADAQKAFTPGAVPHFDDTQSAANTSTLWFDPLSVTAPGDDYFVTSNERGQTTYTRDGSFQLSDGRLCTSEGRPVRGFATPGSALGDVRIDPVDIALGRVNNLRIERDGSVAYDRMTLDPRSGLRSAQRVVAGQLALARFAAGTKTIPSDDGGVRVPAGIDPHVGIAGDGNFGTLELMRHESSRIDLNASLEKLHDAYVAFDALMAAHHAQGATGKVAMDLLK